MKNKKREEYIKLYQMIYDLYLKDGLSSVASEMIKIIEKNKVVGDMNI